MYSEIDLEKSEIRRGISKLKKELTPEQKREKSLEIIKKTEKLKEFENASNILLYSSLDDEVYTAEALKRWSESKKLFLPVVDGENLVIRAYDPDLMRKGSFGIMEPSGQNLSPDIQLMIVPGVSFDKECNRLGRGKGFYDRLLRYNKKSIKVGIAYEFKI